MLGVLLISVFACALLVLPSFPMGKSRRKPTGPRAPINPAHVVQHRRWDDDSTMIH